MPKRSISDLIRQARGKQRANGAHGEPRLPKLLEQIEAILMELEISIDDEGNDCLRSLAQEAQDSGAGVDGALLDEIADELHNRVTDAHSLARQAIKTLHRVEARKTRRPRR